MIQDTYSARRRINELLAELLGRDDPTAQEIRDLMGYWGRDFSIGCDYRDQNAYWGEEDAWQLHHEAA